MLSSPVSLALLALLAVGCPGSSGSLDRRGSQQEQALPLPVDPAVSVGTLRNGAKYLLLPMPTAARATRLELVVLAGSIREEEGERGFAHFIEHVAIDPSQRFGELAPSELLAGLGANGSADSNAETHFSYTRYFLTLPKANPELVRRGLDALAGWASGVRFTSEAVERQRPIVLAELRDAEDQKPGRLARAKQFVNDGSPYADRSPLGTQADVEQASPERLEAFYRRWYAPERWTVVAVGAFDPLKIASLIEERFGAAPSGAEQSRPEPSQAKATESAFIPGEEWLLGNPREEQWPGGTILYLLQLPDPGLRFEQDYAVSLMDRCLCALLENRVGGATHGERFECKTARPGPGQVQIRLRSAAKANALRSGVEAILVELRRIEQHGISEIALQPLKPQVIKAIVQEAQSSRDLRAAAQQLVAYAVDGQVLLSPSTEEALASQLISTIGTKDLEGRARKWLTESRRLLVAIRSEEDVSLTSDQSLGDLVREVRTRSVPPSRAPEFVPELMPVAPTPGTIMHAERLEDLGLQRWALGNGAVVVFKTGRKGGGGALLRGLPPASVRRTESGAADGQYNQVYAPQIVQQSGVGAHDPLALSRLLAEKTTKVRLGRQLEASSSMEDLETTLQLLHLYLTAPRRDPRAFESFLAAMRETAPPALAFLRARVPEAASPLAIADQLNLDGVLNAYQEQMGNVAGFTFLIVADAEEDRIRGLVERYLASLPGTLASSDTARADQRQRASKPVVEGHGALGTPRGISRVRWTGRPGRESQVVLRFEGKVAPSAEGRLDFQLLEVYLRARLREVLREQLGRIYDVDLSSGWNGENFWREIAFECKPEDVEALRLATLDVIGGIDRPGVSGSQLQTLRAWYDARFPGVLQDDAFWLDELGHAIAEGADPHRILELPKLSVRITQENLRRAARRYLPLDSYLDAVWSPAEPANLR